MIYFDESGYTGPDLVNVEQPYFTLASIRLQSDEIIDIKNAVEDEKWGKELHFKKMYVSRKGRQVLERIFSHPLLDSNHVLLAYAEKRYCIYAYIVDILVESYYYHCNINLYEGARNLLLANGLYSFAKLHPAKDLIAEFEGNFVSMVREPSKSSIVDFYRVVGKLMEHEDTEEGFSLLLSEIRPTIMYINEVLSKNKFYIDLTIPLFSGLVQEWYKKTGAKEDILFDSSKPFDAGKSFLERLRDMKVDEAEVGYGKGKHTYPFPIGNIQTADSKNEFGIQLADVFASALNFIITPRSDNFIKYQEELKKLPIFGSVQINLAPSTLTFIKERIKETAEIDPLDFICKHM
ncbi:DUF3800 domain-containing protein [Hoylesella nanceiensis]